MSAIVLEQNLSLLDQFQTPLNWYIKWWNTAAMKTVHQDRNVDIFASDGGELRRKAIRMEWQRLKEEYERYSSEVSEVQNQRQYND